MAERTRLSERDAVFVTLPLESDGEGDEGDEGMGEKGVVFLSDRKDVGEAGPRLDGDDAIGFDDDAEEEAGPGKVRYKAIDSRHLRSEEHLSSNDVRFTKAC